MDTSISTPEAECSQASNPTMSDKDSKPTISDCDKSSVQSDEQIEAANTLMLLQDAGTASLPLSTVTKKPLDPPTPQVSEGTPRLSEGTPHPSEGTSHPPEGTPHPPEGPVQAIITKSTPPQPVPGKLPLKFYYELILEKQEKQANNSRQKIAKNKRSPMTESPASVVIPFRPRPEGRKRKDSMLRGILENQITVQNTPKLHVPQVNVNEIRRNAFKFLKSVKRKKELKDEETAFLSQKDSLDNLSSEILKLVKRQLVEARRQTNRRRTVNLVSKAARIKMRTTGNTIMNVLVPPSTEDHNKQQLTTSVDHTPLPLSPKMTSSDANKISQFVCVQIAHEMAQKFCNENTKDGEKTDCDVSETPPGSAVNKVILRKLCQRIKKKRTKRKANGNKQRQKRVLNALRCKKFKTNCPKIDNLLLPPKLKLNQVLAGSQSKQMSLQGSQKSSSSTTTPLVIPRSILRAALRNMQWKAQYKSATLNTVVATGSSIPATPPVSVPLTTDLKSLLSSLDTVPKGLNLPVLEFLKINFPTLRLETLGDIMQMNTLLSKTLQMQQQVLQTQGTLAKKNLLPGTGTDINMQSVVDLALSQGSSLSTTTGTTVPGSLTPQSNNPTASVSRSGKTPVLVKIIKSQPSTV